MGVSKGELSDITTTPLFVSLTCDPFFRYRACPVDLDKAYIAYSIYSRDSCIDTGVARSLS